MKLKIFSIVALAFVVIGIVACATSFKASNVDFETHTYHLKDSLK